jgi:hypothetical protein
MDDSPVKADTFMNSPDRFFHYEPLFTSFIRLWRGLSAKNLIIPEATVKSIYFKDDTIS